MSRPFLTRDSWWTLMVALVACDAPAAAPIEPCTVARVRYVRAAIAPPPLSVLFVVDTSSSMAEEQPRIAAELAAAARLFASRDVNDDGAQDFFNRVRLAVVTTDLGAGPFEEVRGCAMGLGDDGLLQGAPVADAADDCPARLDPPFLDGREDVAEVSRDARCLTSRGTGGCGFEQPLEAALKALTPSTSELTFAQSTVGHGDGANDGFLPPGAALAVIVVTDEDDCSAASPALFHPDPGNGQYPGPTATRCVRYGSPDDADARSPLHSVERYVEGFLDLVSDPYMLYFGIIGGIPLELLDGTPDVRRILEAPSMQNEIDPDREDPVLPACHTEHGRAAPPRRLLRLAAALQEAGSTVALGSLCAPSFHEVLRPFAERLALREQVDCLHSPLPSAPDGPVACRVLEALPSPADAMPGQPTRCEELRAHGRRPYHCPTTVPLHECYDDRDVPPERDERGGELCVVQQILPAHLRRTETTCTAPEDAHGWFYDDCSWERAWACGDGGQAIRFTPGDRPKPGVRMGFECLEELGAGRGTEERSGAPDGGASAPYYPRCTVDVGPVRGWP